VNRRATQSQAGRLNWPVGAFFSVILLFISAMAAQQEPAQVPTLVSFTGILTADSGRPLSGTVGVTFYLYKDQEGGAPLWLETQNVQGDKAGHYMVELGATKPAGLPVDLFTSGQAQWLGIQISGQSERPRVLLLSVPYALKAADAATVGGLPASAFVLAAPSGTVAASANLGNGGGAASAPPPASSNVTTAGGTVNTLPLFSTATDIENSVVTQTGSGATAKIGIGTATPASTLDVKGNATLRGPVSVMGALTLPSSGAATATAGKISQPLEMAASSFSSGTNAAVNQIFQWQAEPVANDTATPSGTLNLLFGAGTAKPGETGLNIAANGRITFAAGQTFPGVGTITGVTTASGSGLVGGGTSGSLALSLLNTCAKNQTLQWSGTAWACATASGSGTITGVTAGTDLTGGGTTGTVTLNLDTTKVPRLAVANTFTATQTVNSNGGIALNVTQTSTAGSSAIMGTSDSTVAGTAGVVGQSLSINATERFGVEGIIASESNLGAGVFGVNQSPGQTGQQFIGSGSGVWGDAGTFGGFGVLATADTASSLAAFNNSTQSGAILAENLNPGGGVGIPAPAIVGYSLAPNGMSIIGSAPTHSGVFEQQLGVGFVGVAGDGGPAASGGGLNVGVLGMSDAAYGVIGESATGSGIFGQNGIGDVAAESPTAWFESLSPVETTAPVILAQAIGGSCQVETNGDLVCTGSKSAVVHLPDSRWVKLYAVESPENWFEDFGSGQLASGSAEVSLDATFAETVNTTSDYHVFLTPNGDSRGLYVAAKTATAFVVREQDGGKSNITFDYRVVARRKGYETVRLADFSRQQEQRRAMFEVMMKRRRLGSNAMKPGSSSGSRPKIQGPILPPLTRPQQRSSAPVPVAHIGP
jgi:hypothetical protein